MTAWLGSRPEQFCSSRTARAMAVVAFGRAIRYGAAEAQAAGVSCTAGLATDRPKRGPHRAHVAVQTATRRGTGRWSWKKTPAAARKRNKLSAAWCSTPWPRPAALPSDWSCRCWSRNGSRSSRLPRRRAWQDLFLGRVEAIENLPSPPAPLPDRRGGSLPAPRVILSGAFNPLHAGHRRMAEIAEEVLGLPTAMEISILNVDKPALDYLEIDRRLGQFPPEQTVWLTRRPRSTTSRGCFPGRRSWWASIPCGASPIRATMATTATSCCSRSSGSSPGIAVSWSSAGPWGRVSSALRTSIFPTCFAARAARFRRRSSARMCRRRRCEKKVRGRLEKTEIQSKKSETKRKSKGRKFETPVFRAFEFSAFDLFRIS